MVCPSDLAVRRRRRSAACRDKRKNPLLVRPGRGDRWICRLQIGASGEQKNKHGENEEVRTLLVWGLAFLGVYFALSIGLPQLGRVWPVLFENWALYWPQVVAQAIVWGLTAGTLARILALF